MPIKVHTPVNPQMQRTDCCQFTMRAKELKKLYSALKMELLTLEERLDILLQVKLTVQVTQPMQLHLTRSKEFRCTLTQDIIELIDREADLLQRGRSEKSVKALRQRLNNLFLQFIEVTKIETFR